MKNKIVLLLICFVSLSACAQKKSKKSKLVDFTITQKKALKKTGTQLFLKEVISDARCPIGVECIWAGEAQANVSIYKNGKWTDEEIITFSSKKEPENIQWFSEKLSIPVAKIKSIQLVPYPKEGQKIDPKNYVIKVGVN